MDNLLAVVFSFSNVAFTTNIPYDDEDDDMNDLHILDWLVDNKWMDLIQITDNGVHHDPEQVMAMKTKDLNMPFVDYSITQMPYSPN